MDLLVLLAFRVQVYCLTLIEYIVVLESLRLNVKTIYVNLMRC